MPRDDANERKEKREKELKEKNLDDDMIQSILAKEFPPVHGGVGSGRVLMEMPLLANAAVPHSGMDGHRMRVDVHTGSALRVPEDSA